MKDKNGILTKTLIGVILVLFVAGLGYGGYEFYLLNERYVEKERVLASTTVNFTNQVKSLEENLVISKDETDKLSEQLKSSEQKVTQLTKEKKANTKTISTLEKLTTYDPELLQKYSKVFFLNENYIPSKLTIIPAEYIYNQNVTYEIHADIFPNLKKMLDAAANAGIEIDVISAYRSFSTQESLKASYKVTYGAGTANQFSADQGYSEHQLGTTLDFTTPKTGASFNSFEGTAAYLWLLENAYKYGFVLSYPKGNSYYVYEPWHWRYVGEDLAEYLYENKLNFYDLDQREIDKYLVKFFD